MSIIRSKVVPTEYDVSRRVVAGLTLYTLSDDRGRKYTGVTVGRAFRKAEKAQNPADPIHHDPFPDPRNTPLPS